MGRFARTLQMIGSTDSGLEHELSTPNLSVIQGDAGAKGNFNSRLLSSSTKVLSHCPRSSISRKLHQENVPACKKDQTLKLDVCFFFFSFI